jgi:hypothetical protein
MSDGATTAETIVQVVLILLQIGALWFLEGSNRDLWRAFLRGTFKEHGHMRPRDRQRAPKGTPGAPTRPEQ